MLVEGVLAKWIKKWIKKRIKKTACEKKGNMDENLQYRFGVQETSFWPKSQISKNPALENKGGFTFETPVRNGAQGRDGSLYC